MTDLILESLPEGVSWRSLQFIAVRLVDDLNDLVLGLLDGCNDVGVGPGIGNGVADSNAVTLQQQPIVDDGLNVPVELAVFLINKIIVNFPHNIGRMTF